MKSRILITILLWAASVMGCSFDAGGAGGTENGPPGDCTPACMGNTLQRCEPMPIVEPCPLGCDAEALECVSFVPANGASKQQLQGVNKSLAIPAAPSEDDEASIDTDSGRIVVYGQTVRGAGDGIVDGIGFFRLDTGVSVLAVTELSVAPDGFVFAFGSRPLIILSAGDVVIEGVLDVSAFCESDASGACGGPGGGDGRIDGTAPAGGCAPGQDGRGVLGIGDETGGGGGGLGEDGAPGGEGGSTPPGAGGTVQASCPGPELVPLLGGSGGGAGGLLNFGGEGGGGGGAVQITSFTRIEVTGLNVQGGELLPGIAANGGGGGGAVDSSGGGGGGSGGAILLEAPAIALRAATLAANGGGGGGGGNEGEAQAGESGILGEEPAQGGIGLFNGGAGGSAAGAPQPGEGGGDATGGGGGGVGIIRLNVPEANLSIEDMSISPAHTRGDLNIQ